MKEKKIYKILLDLIGVVCIGIGVAFNASAQLGNDPVGIVYDGLRNALNLSHDQLGLASNIINYGLVVIMLLVGRRYINIGTFIYTIPYGFFVNIGTKLYQWIIPSDEIFYRIGASTAGTLILCAGVGLTIAVNIGLDPVTGVVMVIKDKLKWQYRTTKICFDLILIVIGVLMGGIFGWITIITALTAGPIIQFMAKQFIKIINYDKNDKMKNKIEVL